MGVLSFIDEHTRNPVVRDLAICAFSSVGGKTNGSTSLNQIVSEVEEDMKSHYDYIMKSFGNTGMSEDEKRRDSEPVLSDGKMNEREARIRERLSARQEKKIERRKLEPKEFACVRNWEAYNAYSPSERAEFLKDALKILVDSGGIVSDDGGKSYRINVYYSAPSFGQGILKEKKKSRVRRAVSVAGSYSSYFLGRVLSAGRS